MRLPRARPLLARAFDEDDEPIRIAEQISQSEAPPEPGLVTRRAWLDPIEAEANGR